MDSKEKILIVDNNGANIKSLKTSLANRYQIFEAANCQQSLKIIESSPEVDLILLDTQSPRKNGFNLCDKITHDYLAKDIPFIFISPDESIAAEKEGLSMGAVDFITRPFNSSILNLRIKNQLKLKQQRDLLKHLSRTDGLTGLWNRSKFEEFMENEWFRAVREHSSLSLIMLDIDYFKNFNDSYGHTSGDECIKKVAQIINKSLVRSQDLAARYGGEEFICVLPNTRHSGAMYLAETIRKNILKLKVPHKQSKTNSFVTASLGVSTIIPSSFSSAHMLIQATDKMLYKAKKEGRNRVAGHIAPVE
jgi:diguanylate cyclase (GGDEF)-like protein